MVNFAPVLLEQIADYAAQLEDCLGRGSAIRDPLLAALAEPPMPVSPDARSALMKQCLRANRQRIIERFPAYKRLAATAQWVQEHPGTMMYLSDQFLVDLIVWYHLGWMAETVRRADPRVQRLQDKAHGFTVHDRRQLLGILLDMLRSVVPRYRRLAEAGRVELAMSPYAIFGAFDQHSFSYWFEWLMRWPALAPYPVGLNLPLVYAGDLARAVCATLTIDKTIGEALNVGGNNVDFWEFYNIWASSGGFHPALRLPVPVPFKRLFDDSKIRNMTGWRPWILREQLLSW